MGEYQQYQPLTREDRITTVIYRSGIALSALLVALAAAVALTPALRNLPLFTSGLGINVILLSLHLGAGLSVFFIHLYIGKFHRVLKKLYYLATACLLIMFLLGNGNPASLLFRVPPAGAFLLVPLACCLGFVTAKEAFCFKFVEGYLLGMVMPGGLFLYGTGLLDRGSAAVGLGLVAAMYLFFMFRKVFMPLHCDIGDKSAYQP